MGQVSQVVQYANVAVFGLLALASLRYWRRQRTDSAFWISLAFLALTATLGSRLFITDGSEAEIGLWLRKLTAAPAILFPYLLFRFAVSFKPVAAWTRRIALFATTAMLAWLAALPDFNFDAEPRPAYLQLFVYATLSLWTALSGYVTVRLWRAGRGQPTVARRRMRLLAIASLGLNVSIVLVGVALGDTGDLLRRMLMLLSGLLFFLGFAPPTLLRMAWRRPELEALQMAMEKLMGATTPDEVADGLLPYIARVMGGRGAALADPSGQVIATHGVTSDEVEEYLRRAPPLAPSPTGNSESVSGEWLRLGLPFGSLMVRSSAYTPFFGSEECRLIRSLGTLVDLALERCNMFVHERENVATLKAMDEMKNTFLSAVSHELRTPLTSILGFALTLDSRADGMSPVQRQMVHNIATASQRLEGLLSDLLDLDRLTRGVIRPTLAPVDLAQLVETVAAGIDYDGRKAHVEVEPCIVEADAPKVERIVENLLINAFKHTPSTASVTVRVSCGEEGSVISVSDTGPGIADDVKQRIFEPFQRVGAGHARAPGTGIGLSLVREFAELHGGRAWVEDAEGGGSCFKVMLPAHAPGPAGDSGDVQATREAVAARQPSP